MDVHASEKSRVLLAGHQALVRQLHGVGERHVCQGVGAGAADGAGDVRHTVVHDVVDHVGRLGARCRPARFETAALVDGHVDHHGPRRHRLQILPTDEGRGLRPRNQDRPDHEVGACQAVEDVVPVAEEGHHIRRHHVVEVTQAVEIDVQQKHIGPEARCHLGPIRTDDPAAEDDDRGRSDPGRFRSDSALNVRKRTQLLAALSTYRDSDDSGLIPMEGGGYASESESKTAPGSDSENRCHTLSIKWPD